MFLQELIITKQPNERLGMHIKGGLKGLKGNPLDQSDEGVFVTKINGIGAARRDGRLKVGMRLLEVNSKSLLGVTHQEAVNILRSCGNVIRLVVCKGYTKSEVEKAIADGSLQKANSNSLSSLDFLAEDIAHVSFFWQIQYFTTLSNRHTFLSAMFHFLIRCIT